MIAYWQPGVGLMVNGQIVVRDAGEGAGAVAKQWAVDNGLNPALIPVVDRAPTATTASTTAANGPGLARPTDDVSMNVPGANAPAAPRPRWDPPPMDKANTPTGRPFHMSTGGLVTNGAAPTPSRGAINYSGNEFAVMHAPEGWQPPAPTAKDAGSPWNFIAGKVAPDDRVMDQNDAIAAARDSQIAGLRDSSIAAARDSRGGVNLEQALRRVLGEAGNTDPATFALLRQQLGL